MSTAEMNLASGIREFALSSPSAVAVSDGDRRLSFAEVDERSSRLACLMLERGLSIGDRLGVLSRNRLEYVEIAAGAAKCGVTMVPLNPRGTATEHAALLGHSSARGLVFDDALAESVPDAAQGLDLILELGDGGAAPSYEQALAASRNSDPRARYSELLPYAVQYTSGTTGAPKGALLSHRSRVLTLFGCAVDFGLGPGRRTAAVAPMALGAGFAFGYGGAYMGGLTAMMRQWDAEELLVTIERERLHTVFLVPTHALGLQQVMADSPRRWDLSSLQVLYFNAAALPVPLKRWVVDAFPGVAVHEIYGSTEGSVVTNLRPPDELRKAGSVGHPWFLTEVALLDDDRQPVPPGVPGELFSRSPYVMNGYLDDPAATAEAITEDGFLSAGDVAVQDEEGFLTIVDRKKDMIISGGANIYPREVENALLDFDEVGQVAVVGLPDPQWGERVAAFVVPRRGRSVDLSTLEQRLRGTVAAYKLPKQWLLVDELPHNANGKMLKRVLRDQHAGETSQDV